MVWQHGLGLEALRGAVFGTILLGIAMTDARAYIIPDEFSLGGLVIGLLFSGRGGLAGLGLAVLGAAVGFGVLWLVAIGGTGLQEGRDGRRRHQDDGDGRRLPRLAGRAAHHLPRRAARHPHLRPLSLLGQKKLVPFGIFLALGAAATYLVGPAILTWYAATWAGA